MQLQFLIVGGMIYISVRASAISSVTLGFQFLFLGKILGYTEVIIQFYYHGNSSSSCWELMMEA